MKTNISILITILLCISCTKLDFERINKVSPPSVNNSNTWVTVTSAIVDMSESQITEYGHCWSQQPNPSISQTHTNYTTQISKKEFTDTLTHLLPNTTYYLRSYIKNESEIIYGEQQSFTTPENGIQVTCNHVQVVAEQEIVTTSTIANIGSLQIPTYGTIISDIPNAILSGTNTIKKTLLTNAQFSDSFSNLEKGKTYFVQAFAKLSDNITLYSDTVRVTIPLIQLETVQSQITGGTTAQLFGTITNLPFDAITQHGFCWSNTTSNPNYNSQRIDLGTCTQIGNFEAPLQSIIPSQTYYYRAFAKYNNVITYGDIKTFIIQ